MPPPLLVGRSSDSELEKSISAAAFASPFVRRRALLASSGLNPIATSVSIASSSLARKSCSGVITTGSCLGSCLGNGVRARGGGETAGVDDDVSTA